MGRKNQTRLQRVRVISMLVAFIGLLGFAYTNCGGTDGAALYNSERGVFEADATAVSLNITQDPIYIQENDIGFNVGGFCETSIFPANEIVWKLSNVNGATVVNDTRVRSACVEKRFMLTILLPQGYNYNSQHVIEINLNALDENGDVQAEAKVHVNVTSL